MAFATGHRGAAVQTHRQLDPHERQAVFHALEEARVERARFTFQHAAVGFDTGLGQTLQATPGHFRVGVLHPGDHSRDTGAHQCIGARRCPPVVAAGFKGHVHRGATRLVTGGAQRIRLGMGFAGALMPAFADNLPIPHNHAAHTRVGMGGVHALARQFEGAGHVMGVEDGLFCRRCGHFFTGSRARRSISSRNSLRSWKRRYTEAKRI